MQGLLAAALAVVLGAGCSFHSPEGSAPNSGDPDAAVADDAGGDAGALCAGYGYSYNGHKYRLISSAGTWTQAKVSCEAGGGYLLKIETSGEDNQAANAFFGGPSEVWAGLRDVNQNGVYVWTDGTAPAFTHWSGTAPGSASPDCVVKNTYVTDGRWYTRDCTDSKAVICECVP